jgi:2-(1,2-epoxy-1,2-dihydrophenyl)acetyl-CoA isomerase
VILCDVGPRDGLQNEPETLEPAVRAELAARLAAGPTGAYAGIKRQFNAWLFTRMAEQLDLEAALQQQSAASGDFQEGILAFLEKRPPAFGGG